MLHLDDDAIAELIDGELNESARAAATAHLAACAECRARHAEAVAYSEESGRLIAAVGLPRPIRPLRAAPAPVPAPLPRRVPWRAIGWAASVMMAAGIGYYAGVPRPGSPTGVADSRVSADQQTSGTESDRPGLAVEPEGLPRREVAAENQPATSPPTEAEIPQPVAGKRANEAATAVAPLKTADLPARDRAQPAPQAGAVALAQDRSARRDDAAELKGEALPGAKMAGVVPPAVSMEAAVGRLGGSIRLIDGLAPVAVRFIASPAAPRADAGAQTVRVVYLDPPARELWLDQRRIDTGDEQAEGVDGLLAGDTIAGVLADGRRSLRWRDAGGFHLLLSGFLGADSLQLLARRVR